MSASSQDRDNERAMLRRLRFAVDSMSGDNWIVDADAGEVHLVTGRATGEDAHICTIHAAALDTERDLICGALGNAVGLLAIIDRAAHTVRTLKAQAERADNQARKKDFAAQAAMLLSDQQFQLFLETKGAGGPVRDKGAADTRLKFLLNISSKSELNASDRGRAAWIELRGQFEAWKRTGGGQ